MYSDHASSGWAGRVSLRSAAERLTHRLVLYRRLPVPFRDVRMYVSSEAGLRYLKTSLAGVDPTLLRVVDEFVEPGHVVWDIGANIGLFTLAAASRAGRNGHVFSMEADTWNADMLRRSAARQPHSSAPVVVVPLAVADKQGVVEFEIAVRNRATNAISGFGSTQTGGVRQRHRVPAVTLNCLSEHFALPHVLKIDVEGAEALVLGAASRVLAARPVVFCEVTLDNAEAVGNALAQHGYTFYDAAARAPRAGLSAPPFNLLAIASD